VLNKNEVFGTHTTSRPKENSWRLLSVVIVISFNWGFNSYIFVWVYVKIEISVSKTRMYVGRELNHSLLQITEA
jgi:hypothetical protein